MKHSTQIFGRQADQALNSCSQPSLRVMQPVGLSQ
jgi:hypothetical protein